MCRSGGPWKLLTLDGGTMTHQDLKGYYYLIYFGFCNCPDICPNSLYKLTRALERIRASPEGKVISSYEFIHRCWNWKPYSSQWIPIETMPRGSKSFSPTSIPPWSPWRVSPMTTPFWRRLWEPSKYEQSSQQHIDICIQDIVWAWWATQNHRTQTKRTIHHRSHHHNIPDGWWEQLCHSFGKQFGGVWSLQNHRWKNHGKRANQNE